MHWNSRLARLLLAIGLPAAILTVSALESFSASSPSATPATHQLL